MSRGFVSLLTFDVTDSTRSSSWVEGTALRVVNMRPRKAKEGFTVRS
jgi:hypothetical protein